MVNNCNDGQHKRQCNRFMAKVHLNNSISLIALFLSVFLFSYQYQVLADDITYSAVDEDLIPDSVAQFSEKNTQLLENSQLKAIETLNNENNTTNIELNSKYTGLVVADVVSTHPHPDVHDQLQFDEEVNTSISSLIKEEQINSLEHAVDLNNDIFSNIEQRAENKISQNFLNSDSENTILTENLEESIRSSVKTEIELEQNLELSPVLGILKDLPEAEIRKTLTADIMSLNQGIFDKNEVLLQFADEEKYATELIPVEKLEYIGNISKIMESSEINSVNPRDARNLLNQQLKTVNHQYFKDLDSSSTSSSISMQAENSGESSKVADTKQHLMKSPKDANSSLTFSSENNYSDNSWDNSKKKEKDLTENLYHEANEDITNIEEIVDLTIPETSYDLESKVNTSSRNISIFIADETNGNALSLVLNEIYSTSESYSGDEDPIRFDENVEFTTEEQVERITVLPEKSEHIVVKKVLVVQGIFDDIAETTLIPLKLPAQKTKMQSNAVNEEDHLVKSKVYDDQIQDLKTKVEDREVKLVYADEIPELNSKEDDHEAKLVQKGEILNLNSKGDDQELKLLHKDEISEPNKANANKLQAQHQSYFETEQELTTLQPNNESQSLRNHFQFVEQTESAPSSENKSLYDKAATFFEAYLPRDSGQTFNNNLADEFAGIGKALPISVGDGSSRSTLIVVLSSGTALLFVVISLTIFLISFQRQNGTLDIEMQERSCGKDDLDEEDVGTFSKLLAVELPASVALALDDTEECL